MTAVAILKPNTTTGMLLGVKVKQGTELGEALVTDDVDGDGVRDIIVSSRHDGDTIGRGRLLVIFMQAGVPAYGGEPGKAQGQSIHRAGVHPWYAVGGQVMGECESGCTANVLCESSWW